jgi:hypothetical protein
MYGSEYWVLNRSERRETETAEMHFLRSVSEYTLTDHVRSTTLNALQIYSLEERLQDYKNKWLIHILRMDCSRLAPKNKHYLADR